MRLGICYMILIDGVLFSLAGIVFLLWWVSIFMLIYQLRKEDETVIKKRKRSHLLAEKPISTLPKLELSTHIKELFKKSDKAIRRLRSMTD